MPERSLSRRPALIATAVAVPVVVLLAFALTAGRTTDNGAAPSATAQPTGVLGPVTEAPVTAGPATTAACAQVIGQLPTTLNGRLARPVRGGGPLVKAWGQPPVVLRCGVTRPPELKPNADSFVLAVGVKATVLWLPQDDSKGRVFTTIDRAVYVQAIMPDSGTAGEVLPTLSDAVAAALPAVCKAPDNPPPASLPPNYDATLCTHRK